MRIWVNVNWSFSPHVQLETSTSWDLEIPDIDERLTEKNAFLDCLQQTDDGISQQTYQLSINHLNHFYNI